MLTSWTTPLTTGAEIGNVVQEGEDYMLTLDEMVRKTYVGEEPASLAFCRATLEKLGLPAFLVTPLVDKAFRSHLEN